ncbi:hypothetical protein CTAYLR_005969 [Chrysophaeum taylorii]|uniref:Uncharacterized protein n=1 Tax=Chrysophaeum taylorii TaxID=2483200 RepID=A0AAD7UKN0_9STRA|nr:hypothetical protein CTAYLR_005969 [Chrysophaeum taylorii]
MLRREANGCFNFADKPAFRPNLSPEEVLRAGAFGGGYFRDITSTVTSESYVDAWRELPKDWIKGLDVKTRLASQVYRKEVNKYGVDCGGKAGKDDAFGLKAWETAGWMRPQDPYGWFQWYCRFFAGRRTDDDDRQISRWVKCAGDRGRWRSNLVAKCLRDGRAFDDRTVSPVVRQTLLHWAYDLTLADFEAAAARVKINGATYVPRSSLARVMRPPQEEEEEEEKEEEEEEETTTTSRKKKRRRRTT